MTAYAAASTPVAPHAIGRGIAVSAALHAAVALAVVLFARGSAAPVARAVYRVTLVAAPAGPSAASVGGGAVSTTVPSAPPPARPARAIVPLHHAPAAHSTPAAPTSPAPKPTAARPVPPKPVVPKPVVAKAVAAKPVVLKAIAPKPVAPKAAAAKTVVPKAVPPKPVAPHPITATSAAATRVAPKRAAPADHAPTDHAPTAKGSTAEHATTHDAARTPVHGTIAPTAPSGAHGDAAPAHHGVPNAHAPASGSAAGAASARGHDVADVRVVGLEFPFPGYLDNLVRQVRVRFAPTPTRAPLHADLAFVVARDGSISGLRVVRTSGNYAFDLEAQGAVEAAGAARAFGPLPDGFRAAALPVTFSFDPRATP